MKNLFLGCLFVFIFAISTCAFSFADFTQEEHQSALNFTDSTLEEQQSGLNFTNSTQEEQQSAFSSTDSIEEEQSAFNVTQYRLGVHPSRNTTRHKRRLWYWRSAGCTLTGNPIDDCWRCDPHWHSRRKRLADCVTGFGKNTIGGRDGAFYTVYDSSDDPVNPRPGTLRYGVIQKEPLWIVFARDMTIVLKQELIVNSHKTIDGRGHIIRIAYGGCITIQYVRNVIIHGIGIHSCRRTGPAMVRSSTDHVGWRTVSDGDGISIFGSRDIWIDHCFLANCADGLIDAIMGSTGITISNNYFRDHNKVMLLGHSDAYTQDKTMQVTIAYNHFGEGLVQRMPRCRYGYFHIVNNHYSHWKMYAIGGSANPTINSQGNRFVAPADLNSKQVTKREFSNEGNWLRWNWRTQGDSFINGAYFRPSGAGSGAIYNKVDSLAAKPASSVPALTAFAGPLECSRRRGIRC